ncbi:MAG: NADAR family protein [Nocardia sp.]|nr:NADAR family protein [Nocardia sp.]
MRFHRLSDEYADLTNFARFPIVLAGRVWPSTEHWFQANKFTSARIQETIRNAPSPQVAAKLGRDRSVPIRPDWQTARIEVMRLGMWAKFTQHPRARRKLLGTGNAPLVEDTRGDRFWGAGADGAGRNINGRLLEGIRDELNRQPVRWRGEGDEPSQGWVLFGNGLLVVPPHRQARARGTSPFGEVHVLPEYQPGGDARVIEVEWVQGPVTNSTEVS